MKKIGRFTTALLIAGVFIIGSNNAAEASGWKDGETGFQAGCALSEWLGWFKCHPSQVPW
ncbi:hypothetical protein [Paenibacillus faecalis]|uniref:hypothetical protein n=1 Tax=Paenibacillus faecalis TaxID=2079532 RepID=UPI000D0F5A2F|nr:hypothetical protein [Paenibacillus faecalis]